MDVKDKRLLVGVCGGQWGDGGVGKTAVVNILTKHMGFYPTSFSTPVKDVAKKLFGWNGKMDTDARILLDQICKMGRGISEHYWINLTLINIPNEAKKIVVDDIWFDNEASMIEQCGGFVLRIIRPGYEYTPLSCNTIDIVNDGTLAQLQRKVLLAVMQATE